MYLQNKEISNIKAKEMEKKVPSFLVTILLSDFDLATIFLVSPTKRKKKSASLFTNMSLINHYRYLKKKSNHKV